MTATTETPRVDFKQLAQDHMGDGGLLVYESDALVAAAKSLLDLDMPYGLTVRYAAKANPHPEIISLFDNMGLHFDASSAYEAAYLLECGVSGERISLSSQILQENSTLTTVIDQGVLPVATSARQLEMLNKLGCKKLAIRVNPGIGSGHNNRTNVGGPASSFGIWHEELSGVAEVAAKNGQTIDRLHTHIGSGADPDIWRSVIQKSLSIVDQLPDVTTLDIGGGYKVARMPGEKSTDMQQVGAVFADEIEKFAVKTGRKIRLEIEPGTYLVANAGTLLGRVEETAKTDQYEFLKLNVGMNAILRPSLYGAQHPIEVLNDATETDDYVVVGPCCESGDILTPTPGDPEGILPRKLKKAKVGDSVAIGGAGAYCASMSVTQYNHIPKATEILV